MIKRDETRKEWLARMEEKLVQTLIMENLNGPANEEVSGLLFERSKKKKEREKNVHITITIKMAKLTCYIFLTKLAFFLLF